VAIWQHYKRVWAYFHRACAETAISELPVKNLTPPFAPSTSISNKTDAFPLPNDVYGIYLMFFCYYVAWPCDLDLWPFDLKSVSCTVLLTYEPHTNFHYPMTIGYWVTSTEYLITFLLSEQSLCMRRVTWPLTGGKNSPHFWNPRPKFVHSLCNFHGATTKIKREWVSSCLTAHQHKVFSAIIS